MSTQLWAMERRAFVRYQVLGHGTKFNRTRKAGGRRDCPPLFAILVLALLLRAGEVSKAGEQVGMGGELGRELLLPARSGVWTSKRDYAGNNNLEPRICILTQRKAQEVQNAGDQMGAHGVLAMVAHPR